MYIRTVTRKNKDNSEVRYIQVAHNFWDPKARRSQTKVLFNLGREEEVDKEALKRLVSSIARFLGPEEVFKAGIELSGNKRVSFVSSQELGGPWLLEKLWKVLGIQATLRDLLKARAYQAPIERALFAMVANRALAPASKLAVEDWVRDEVWIKDLPEVPVHQLYRAMDFLLEAAAEVQREVFFATANLFNLEVDLIYFDTTSTYFEVEEPDTPEDSKQHLRQRGHSKDHRSDLPQVVIGLAVTREGLPVRCWVWPGNTADMSVVNEVKRDLIGWKLGHVITVVDRGFVLEENLITLQHAGGQYIAGEKLRSGKETAEAAINRAGRYKVVRDNLQVKEIVVGEGERRIRYVLVRNPKEAEKQKAERKRIIAEVKEQLKAIGDLKGEPHTKDCCELIAHPVYGRYVKTDAKGQPVLNEAEIKQEAKLDGKYLLRTSDDTLSAEDVALGYKQLLEVEDAFRSLKQTLELRPVYHRLSDRIRAHVLRCWLALLMIRAAELKTGQTWRRIRAAMAQMHLGDFRGPDGRILQRTELTLSQRAIFNALGVEEPPLIFAIEPARKPV